MAQQIIQMAKEKLCCSVCLDLLKDPVTLPCGHSYCLRCIEGYLDEEVHGCPQCRQTFTPRPVLKRNTVLADLVAEQKETGLEAAPVGPCFAGAENVACDVCSGKKRNAVKSCLQCLVSYCELHLQPHYQSPAFGKHKLVDPCNKLQENACARHSEVMKIFCRTDQQCICYLCSMDEHKGHDTVSVAAEMREKQRELAARREKIKQKIQSREESVKGLQQEEEDINCFADEAVKDSKRILSDVKQQIRSRQKSDTTRVHKQQEKLQEEIAELRSRNAELEFLTHTEDHTQFLSSYTSLSRPSVSADSPSATVRPLPFTAYVEAVMSEVSETLQDIVFKEWTKKPQSGSQVDDFKVPQEPQTRDELLKNSCQEPQTRDELLKNSCQEPQTRDELLKNSCQVTLDSSTAHCNVYMNNDREVTYYKDSGSGPGHPDQFTSWCQVLCHEGLTGRCYWEVQWTGTEVFVAVAYRDIQRAGHESAFGHNKKSWVLQCNNKRYEFRHNNIRSDVSGPLSNRIGVYLDHSARVLSFYSISEDQTTTLLHRVQTTFSRPLCPGLGLYRHKNSAKISNALNEK
ncbi:tripartite motif-containing protein 16-like [Solea solea]|uniref:tripartite motif-containing protein 16-like n=1 Tax=Solea solea TaxID=90069 RepID=UPI00272A455F|nr:tripartite motif-containing protein 16-like [Solea solea]